MSNVFTYLRDPGLAIHCHQVAFSALPPLYKTQLVTLTVMLHGFPNNLLAKWEVWVLKDRYNSELNARFVLTNRIACRNTLWGLAWVNQFTEDRDPALLSELWEKCAIWIGPSMLCLSKVPVCMCVCVTWYSVISTSTLTIVSWLMWEAPVSFPDKYWQGLLYTWMRCVCCLNREFIPMISCFDSTFFRCTWCSLCIISNLCPKGKLNKNFNSFLIHWLIRDAPSRS